MSEVAVITGGGSGLGRSAAQKLAEKGINIVVVDVNEDGGHGTVDLVKESGSDAIFIKADVSKAEEVKHYVDKAVEKYGTIDYFFNNAGISGSGKYFLESDIEEINKIVEINMLGALYGMRFVAEVMVKNGGGSIVNMSSSAGVIGQSTVVTYSATKHGIVGMTKSMVAEYAKDGLRVNAVAPGGTETPMVEKYFTDNPQMKEMAEQGIPQKRLGTPEEVAELVTFLLTSGAEYINGEVIRIDGGFTSTK
ncbi:SDR family NAD(P)-dependent oxidoreductase [Salipaludibacillus aurantiacus]|uniref:NAD(P)-dependent dehydrogenase, short-chain alcohol dehydrogenase family n=1 Tax=Salipaludibacillus aurantiacus TaxID=1601833 RepID=A0A1H9S6D0_9BACI|nr:SDR family oxidoreductase [Salipaludibacillus aurantiacus]SER80175.1 NAD(P)-dependent dehydrogenase, short-chain alcohol dehydrogenase family [Salipaludibacillus aurantiacus]